jgi:hypothetical protein
MSKADTPCWFDHGITECLGCLPEEASASSMVVNSERVMWLSMVPAYIPVAGGFVGQ